MSPSTVTTCGSAVAPISSKPGAGSPVTSGLMVSVLDSLFEKTGIVTRAVPGSTFTWSTASPSSSTGTRLSPGRRRGPDWIKTLACAATTWVRTDAGPETLTCVRVDGGRAELRAGRGRRPRGQ